LDIRNVRFGTVGVVEPKGNAGAEDLAPKLLDLHKQSDRNAQPERKLIGFRVIGRGRVNHPIAEIPLLSIRDKPTKVLKVINARPL
jgi:hypothetical protein